LLVGGTMIRHALPSCTVTATSGSVHGATTRSCLIAPPSFPLVLAAGILRAGSEAVDLAAIAVPTDKNLRAAATTQKQSARHFIGAVRHINPQPSAVSSSLQPRADRACRRARASQGQALRVAAKTRPALTGPARDGCAIWRSGRKNARGAGRTKEWNLRTQYPNRYSIFAAPHRRHHVRYQSGSPFTEGGSQRLMSVVSGQKTMGNADTARITSILWRTSAAGNGPCPSSGGDRKPSGACTRCACGKRWRRLGPL
jgi:hypothetical protein